MQVPNEAPLHEKLFLQTSRHHMTGILEPVLEDGMKDGMKHGMKMKDARVRACNTLLPFVGEEGEGRGGGAVEGMRLREMGVHHEVVARWIDGAEQLSSATQETQFTYTIQGTIFKARVGLFEPDSKLFWYIVKRAKAKSNIAYNPLKSSTGIPLPSSARWILDTIPSLVWVFDQNNVTYVNRQWSEYVPCKGEICVPMDQVKTIWQTICHPDEFADSWTKFTRSVHEQEACDSEVRIKCDDGDYRWFSARTAPVIDEIDNTCKWVGTCTDIHDQKMETQAHVDKAVTNFLATMSHEMRTPLSGIMGLLDWLTGTSLSPEQLDCCATMTICAESLLVVINNLLDIRKLEDGKVEICLNDMSPVKSVEVCVDMFSKQAERKKIEMIYNIDFEMPELVVSDNYRYQQVLTNLLSNAVKFTPEGGEIEVKLQVLGEEQVLPFIQDPKEIEAARTIFGKSLVWLQCAVRDTGIGIAKEMIPSLFRRFSKAEILLKPEIRGSGLGLPICRNIATLMHGSILVNSDTDQGSIFFFTVPVGTSNHSPSSSPGTSPASLPAPTPPFLSPSSSSQPMHSPSSSSTPHFLSPSATPASPFLPPPPSPLSPVPISAPSIPLNPDPALPSSPSRSILPAPNPPSLSPSASSPACHSPITSPPLVPSYSAPSFTSYPPSLASSLPSFLPPIPQPVLSPSPSFPSLPALSPTSIPPSSPFSLPSTSPSLPSLPSMSPSSISASSPFLPSTSPSLSSPSLPSPIITSPVPSRNKPLSPPIPPLLAVVLVLSPALRKILIAKLQYYGLSITSLQEYKKIAKIDKKKAEEEEEAAKSREKNDGEKQGEKKGEEKKEEEKKEGGHRRCCIIFVDEPLWMEVDEEAKEWLTKNGRVCIVRMGQKDLKAEDGTRRLVKPIKDHQLFAECDIFARSCELPIKNTNPNDPDRELSRSSDASLELLGGQFPLKVLLADDSSVNLQVAGKLLQKLGYKVAGTCVNGALVLKYFSTNGLVDVVLMDMQMPELDGCEATKLIREQYPTSLVHVIGFTATAFAEDREKCLSAGMCSFLSKPVKISELEAELIKAWRAINLRIVCNCNRHLPIGDGT